MEVVFVERIVGRFVFEPDPLNNEEVVESLRSNYNDKTQKAND